MGPAWYVLRSRAAWARWFNLLHWPYTLWHLSYVVMGAAIAPDVGYLVLGLLLVAFALGMGIGAHCFDLLHGDPLSLGFDDLLLELVGGGALLAAGALGVLAVFAGLVSPWLLLAIPLGAVFALGYGLELPGLHGDWQFAAWWAVFPLMTSFLAQDAGLRWVLLPMVLFAYATARGQRTLSTRARFIRRKVQEATVELQTSSGDLVHREDARAWLLAPEEEALRWFCLAMPVIAVALLLLGSARF